MGDPGDSRLTSRHMLIVALAVGAAMVVGGGGSPNPGTELALQLLFVLALAGWLWWAPGGQTSIEGQHIAGEIWWVALIVIAVPVIQLLPLPPSLWQALPGRETTLAGLALVDAETSWRPISLAPPQTLASLLAMIPPVLAMLAIASLGSRARRRIVGMIAWVALAGALLGGLQMVGGENALRVYDDTHRGWLVGFHANRNAAADVLLIGTLALGAWFVHRRWRGELRGRPAIVLFGVAQTIFVIAILLTGSRAGIALLLPVLLLHLAMFRRDILPRMARASVLAGAGVLAGFLLLPLAIGANSRLFVIAARFDALEDARPDLWTDSMAALFAYWPAGSGLGTFVTAFLPFERLEVVDRSMPNRVHNDYLEFLLEAGLLAPLVLATLALLLARLAWRAWHGAVRDRPTIILALGILLVIALHSIIDYPLRNMAMSVLVGVAAGLLSVPRRRGGSDERSFGA